MTGDSSNRAAQLKAAATYNAAADAYDAPANSFWERFGARTIDRLTLEPGARVLDVCCGSGASALHAAAAVGPTGSVLGVDLAEDLLALARAKAAARGLRNVEFRVGDMLNLHVPDASFDVVVCVFGIFFVPDIPAAVRELGRCLKAGGRLAITTWGPRVFEPANSIFWNAVGAIRPDLYKGFNPWDRITEPPSVKAVLAEGGAFTDDVVAEAGTHPIDGPDDWWSLVMGSGYRGTVEQLSADDKRRLRDANDLQIFLQKITAVETNVVYATSHAPAS